MSFLSRKEAIILFLGDIFFFVFSLWTALYLRFGEAPSFDKFKVHIIPFSILFLAWFVIYFIAGLYEKHTLILKSKLPNIIFNTQVANSLLAIVFFYAIPVFGITPKTILFIYLVISFICILLWRLYGISLFANKEKQPALLIGAGEEMKELLNEVNNNTRYDLAFISSVDVNEMDSIDIQEDIIKAVYSNDIKIIAIDFSNKKVAPLLPHLYNLIFSKVRFIDSHRIYEDIFDRIPLSLVTYSWFLENISVSPKFKYGLPKKGACDVCIEKISVIKARGKVTNAIIVSVFIVSFCFVERSESLVSRRSTTSSLLLAIMSCTLVNSVFRSSV